MRTFIEKLRRIDTPLVWGIICVIFGVAFIAVPTKILDVVLLIVGIPTVIVGILKLVDSISAPKYPMVVYVINIVKSAFITLLGLSLMGSRTGVSYTICSCIGSYIGFASVIGIIRAVRTPTEMRGTEWWRDMIISTVLAVFAIWLAFWPTWPEILAGVSLLLVSVELFRKVHNPRARTVADSAKDVFEGVFTDRSDD